MSTLSRFALSALSIATLGLASASAINLDNLVKNSPFGGNAPAPIGPGAAPNTLEFRGMYTDGGINYYSIYNTQTKQSTWVAEGEAPSTNVPVVVKGFDAVNETLNIDNEGQPQQMTLHQALVVTYKGPSPAQLAAVSNSIQNPIPQTKFSGPPLGNTPANLTPEQVEAFRKQMSERYGKRGDDARDTDSRNRTPETTSSKTKPSKNSAPSSGKVPKSSR